MMRVEGEVEHGEREILTRSAQSAVVTVVHVHSYSTPFMQIHVYCILTKMVLQILSILIMHTSLTHRRLLRLIMHATRQCIHGKINNIAMVHDKGQVPGITV